MGWIELVARLLMKWVAAELENAMNVSAHWLRHSQVASLQFKIKNSKLKIKDNQWGLEPTTD
jgi:hypothetical protein